MRLLKRLFGVKDHVYLIVQDKVLNDEAERKLKEEIHGYIKKSLRSGLFKRKLEYADYYLGKTTKTFSFLCSFEPRNNPWFLPLTYDIYAFAHLDDINIFQDYEYETKEFSNDFQTIKILKFKLKA
jgi:hypothetical protein